MHHGSVNSAFTFSFISTVNLDSWYRIHIITNGSSNCLLELSLWRSLQEEFEQGV